jgi:hypothetical protein
MSATEIALVALGAFAVAVWLIWIPAQRLDRLHRRVVQARASLGHQLTERAVAALDLAHAAVLDPASSIVLAQSARAAVAAMADDGGPAPESGPIQSELTATCRVALGGPSDVAALPGDARELVDDVIKAWYRVTLARRFYNEAVDQTRRRRQTVPVRLLRLAGRTPMPATFEMDDSLPEELTRAA